MSTPPLQNPADRNRSVKFIKWDAERRSKIDLADLEDIVFDKGKFIRIADEDMAMIDWEENRDGTIVLVRSLHFPTEFEEFKTPIFKSLPTADEESEAKVAYIKDNKLRLLKDNSGRRFFRDSKNREWSTADINLRYQAYQLSKAVIERLAIVAELDRDYATSENGVGFSKNDSEWGHKLVEWFQDKGFLTIPMLKGAIKLAHRYRKQIELHAMAKGLQFTPITNYRGIKELEELGPDKLDKL